MSFALWEIAKAAGTLQHYNRKFETIWINTTSCSKRCRMCVEHKRGGGCVWCCAPLQQTAPSSEHQTFNEIGVTRGLPLGLTAPRHSCMCGKMRCGRSEHTPLNNNLNHRPSRNGFLFIWGVHNVSVWLVAMHENISHTPRFIILQLTIEDSPWLDGMILKPLYSEKTARYSFLNLIRALMVFLLASNLKKSRLTFFFFKFHYFTNLNKKG